jgi:hypothetical protein
LKHQDKHRSWETILPTGRIIARLASFAFGTAVFAGLAMADLVTVHFDPLQATPAGETGSPPAAETANNDFSLWGVQYQLTGGDTTGCASAGGYSLCFGDDVGTSDLDLSLLSDPVLSGPLVPDVALTLTFAAGTTDLDFAAAVGTLLDTSTCPLTSESYPGAMSGCPASVALYNSSGSLIAGGTYLWTVPNDSFITEGEFSYSGPAIWQAVLTFPGADSSDTEFAVDNLTYRNSGSQVAPEPLSSVLFGLALIAFGCCRRHRIG